MGSDDRPSDGVRLSTARGRYLLAAAALGSGISFLDRSAVNVALPVLGADLGASVAGLQWIVSAYALVLASLIVLSGALADRFGRRRMFLLGVAVFAVASALCGAAPDVPLLVAARGLQGVGGALLTPASLALLSASYAPEDRARAIGWWSAFTGVAAAAGPLLGGVLLEVSWRLIFLINLPVAAAVIALTLRHVGEPPVQKRTGAFDVPGAALGVMALGALTYALTAGGDGQGTVAAASGVLAVVAGAAFVAREVRTPEPMIPPALFASGLFRAINAVTLVVYAGLAGMTFLLVLQLQVVSGYSPLQAGAALVPVTAVMLAFSGRAGALSASIGARLPLTAGCLLSAAGTALLATVGPTAPYARSVLPGVLLFAAGLTLIVAPLTATALAAAEDRHSGVAGGINTAVAAAAGLLAVAVLPLLAGLSGTEYQRPEILAGAYATGMTWTAATLALGALVTAVTVRTPKLAPHDRKRT